MNRSLLLLTATLLAYTGMAQLQFNPQLGVTFQQLTNAPERATYKANAGWILGMDVRIGDTFFLQPGAFFGRNATTVTQQITSGSGSGTVTTIEDDIIRTYLKLRVLGGWKLINGDAFKLRLAVGPSYDMLLSVDNTNEDISYNQEAYFANGSFNLEAGLGMDIAFFTVEPGVAFGLTQVYNDNILVKDIDSKYLTFYLTVGLVFGKGH
ncbi:MAG: outer membrane beta-barrel protein [Flavobacteriales bacterium]|nr:outer membrane beta-barrel protein [Flavobacteriales bacterium]